ncbi:poly(ADP-ribose) polymerase family member 14-related sequence 1 isoform X2 [Melanotaenia boesemani]|uniref:poly(ADP-ribose) polymerase family member 14-related sequence 1 isoform X2 n=1 Tax=Melanotaenia boesemani TaxID=1250792 RepID=UPI001C048234|nr:poly(ADP-ribose) polymerase family member 14-related sequence 1 isoform X2 [Melanotaenia boesemani]
MADAYSYTLLVELEENKIPKLKNKLVKYFQSKKSNGGDCEVDYQDGSGTAVLRFRKEEDQKNVLAKETHQISLDKGLLKMKVRLPSQEKTTEKTPSGKVEKENKKADIKQPDADEHDPADSVQKDAKVRDSDTTDEEELSSTSAVFENIPDNVSQEFLEMLVENVLKDLSSSSSSQDFMLEVIPDISSAVVTFQSGKENTEFIAKCSENRMFAKKKLSIRPLEVTKQVIVDDIKNLCEDLLQLYFDKEGGDVEDVTLNEAEQTAVITFKDHQALSKVIKKKHIIKQEEIRVYPFYKSLGLALYGKDKPSPKLPPAISEPIDGAVWRYLSKNQAAAEIIRSDLIKHYCNVNFDQSTVLLSPVSSLLKQKDAKTIIKDWKETIKSAFGKSMSKFKSLKFRPELEQWEESEEKIRQTLMNEQVVVVPDKASGVLSVVGLVKDVNRVESQLSEVLSMIEQKMQRAKLSKTQEITASPSMFHILSQDGLRDKILQACPELEMSYNQSNLAIKLTGFVDEIIAASRVINDAMFALKRQNLEVDSSVFDLLKYAQQDELTDALLTSKGINAALEVSARRVQIAAVSDKDLNDAQDHLGKLLLSQSIDVEDASVLDMPEWKHLVSQLEKANTDSCLKTQIQASPQQVVVCGLKDRVIKVSNELNDFLTQNAHIEEAVAIQANVVTEYLQIFNTSWRKQLDDNVTVSFRKGAILLSGSRAAVENSKTVVKNLVSSLFFGTLEVHKPGAKKFFQLKEKMYVNSLKTETGCLVQLVDYVGGKQDGLDLGLVQQPVYQVQTTDGVEIVVCKGDMCSYPVHTVVNAATSDLKLDSGLAKALLKAAGPQLQGECDKIISVRGNLKPGDCQITGAGGQLCCKNVIHAVGPMFDQAKPKKAQTQLKRAVLNSLELAESHSCPSVALPAISRTLGFPLGLCTITIVQAVKEYCDGKCEDTLKMIHLVDNDDSVVAAMEAAVRKEFGNQGSAHSQKAPPPKAIKSAVVKQAASDTSLCQAQTKEGLDIILKKGNIQAAKTDVIVNTIAEDLILSKGAVSNAILGAAGSKLQQLVDNQNATGMPGEVIVTDGCKLKCKQVFHVIAPSWDNNQGTAEKTLRGIFQDCLGLAESTRVSSMSFPAVGTGNLGFPKDLVASLMLDKILEFSSTKQPKHLKKVEIVLYPGDAQTIQEFSDEFMRRFSGTSGGSLATSSSKNTGPFFKVVSSSGMCETKMGNVTVQVATGDITQETTDVIVNSSNEKFTLKTGVSKAILDAAGQAVEATCRTLGLEPNQGMIMTQPGNLKCKKILHLVGKTDPVKINKVVKDALQMCIDNHYTSVSLPAIGTGQGNTQAKQVADSMLDAVSDVLSQNPSSSLTTIRIVIFQQPMLQDFSTSMQQREGTEQKDKGGFWMNLGSKIKTLFVGESSDKPQNEEDFVIVASKVDPACFHICSDAQPKVDAAKKWINDLIANEQNRIVLTDNAIFNMSSADRQRIFDIQKKNDVSVKTEIKNEKISIVIEGLSRNVIEASRDIDNILRQVRDEQEFKKRVELAGTVVDWQYRQHKFQFQSFDSLTNYQLEQAFEQSQPTVKIKFQGQTYTVDVSKREATDSQGNILQIKRIDKLKDGDVPAHWDFMPPTTTCAAFPLPAGSLEYTDVFNLFQITCKRSITKIERIQNLGLWKSLQIKKEELEMRNGHQNNEKRLFHGTSEPTIPTVNERGFNRSYAGKNAACYGNGSYFAVDASYSAHDTYSKPNQNGEKFMYLCRVLVGDYTTGQSGMIAPPAKGSSNTEMFDSVVDNMTKPCMFVIFNDIQAYPEYLITFK